MTVIPGPRGTLSALKPGDPSQKGTSESLPAHTLLLVMAPGPSVMQHFCQMNWEPVFRGLMLLGQVSSPGKSRERGSQPDHPPASAVLSDAAPQPRSQGARPSQSPEQPRRGVSQTWSTVYKPVPFLPPPFRRCWTNARTSGPATSWSIAVYLDLTFVQEAVNTSWSPLNANLVSNC